MALDDRGNPQVDFVWGNIPMQPNYDYDTETTFRLGYSVRPGDGEAEYYTKGHATAADWGNPDYFPADYMFPSEFLTGSGNDPVALKKWSGYPGSDPEQGFELTVNWWNEGIPAMQFPNVVGKTVEEAFAIYRNLGVAENFLSDTLTNATNPYAYGEGEDAGWLPTSGVLIWRYLDPDYVIGQHWDGSDWLAKEAEGLILYTPTWVGGDTALGSYYYDGENYINTSDPNQEGIRYPYWLSICAIQTTDPTKNSWDWWN